MSSHCRFWGVVLALGFGGMALAVDEPVKVRIGLNHENGVFERGEEVIFTIDVPVRPGCRLRYSVDGDRKLTPLTAVPADGRPLTLQFQPDVPAWFCVAAELTDDNGRVLPGSRNMLGAIVAPSDIRQAGAEPADFDAFWAEQRRLLDQVPVKVPEFREVEPPEQYRGRYRCYDVKVDCFGDKPVSGYLTIPVGARPKSLPAMVYYHGAGWCSANWHFEPDAISFDVNAHGIENGKPAEFYADLQKNALADYMYRGMADREKSYFRNMFLRVLRSLDYVKTLPEWDGRRILVYGSSQGGAQALVAAALDHDVTAVAAGVPAMCDHLGALDRRRPGWPGFLARAAATGQVPEATRTAGYYDAASFARRIRCEVFMSAGLIDLTCSPTSVYAAFNNLPAATVKTLDVAPDKGHDASIIQSYRKRFQEIRQASPEKTGRQ